VIDGSRITAGMKVNLVPEEFAPGGPFCDLHDWLDENMKDFGFFRPYGTDRGGVSPERWHLSYAPLAGQYLRELSPELVERALRDSSVLLKEELFQNLPTLFVRYVTNIDP
jgi:hypothetical protein